MSLKSPPRFSTFSSSSSSSSSSTSTSTSSSRPSPPVMRQAPTKYPPLRPHPPSSSQPPSFAPASHPPLFPYSSPSSSSTRPIVPAPAASHAPPAAPQPRPAPAQPNQTFQLRNMAPLVNFDEPIHPLPIVALNPYQSNWVIKARVTAKSEMRSWSNQRGDGRLFSVDLLDQTGEIRALAFNDVADKLFQVLQVGHVYYIARCALKLANTKFTSIANNYELNFDQNSEVVRSQDEKGSEELPTMNFTLMKIDQLQLANPGSIVDLLGIVIDADEVVFIKTKNGENRKRDLTLVDTSGCAVTLTAWGVNIDLIEVTNNPVYAFKSLRASDFNGRSLSTTASTAIYLNPDLPDARELRDWFDHQGGSQLQFRSITVQPLKGLGLPRKTLAEVRDEGLGTQEGDGDLLFYIKASMLLMPTENQTIAYPGCPSEGCSRKVLEEAPNRWFCEKCNKHFPDCVNRYSISMSIADFSGQAWGRAFNDAGLAMFGQTADELLTLRNQDPGAFLKIFQDTLFRPFNFRVRVKPEMIGDSPKPVIQLFGAYPIDYVRESRTLLEAISKYD